METIQKKKVGRPKKEKSNEVKNTKKVDAFNSWRKNQPNRFNGTIFDFRTPGRKKSAEAYIVDGMMGYGKTSAAINFINDQPDFIKFIYITPYLAEIDRIKECCSSRNFVTPDTQNLNGSKMYSFLKLLEQGKNIISTHALFHNFDENCLKLLRVNNYILIMDEVADVIEPIKIVKEDMKLLLALDDKCNPIKNKKPLARINEDNGQLEWLQPNYVGKLDEYKNPAYLGCLFGYGSQNDGNGAENIEEIDTEEEKLNEKNLECYEGSEEEYKETIEENEIEKIAQIKCPSMLMWNYPVAIYEAFYKIFILTYMFEGQMQCGYYKMHGIPYKYIKVQHEEIKVGEEVKVDYNFIPELFDKPQEFDTTKYQQLIHIEENYNLNNIGDKNAFSKKIPLSKSWFNKEKHLLPVLRKKTYNYFNNIMRKVDSQYKMWTTFKDYKKDVQDKGYTKNFIELNARATNKYKDRYVLAYLADRYPLTPVLKFLQSHNISIDQDQFALSEMLQWIFRSRIRDEKEIWIYIPSLRMRNLLKVWMGLEPESEW